MPAPGWKRLAGTWNSPGLSKSDFGAALISIGATKAVVGEETAPTTGTRHFQWAAVFANNTTYQDIHGVHATIHVEKMVKPWLANLHYCTKDDKDAFVHGCVTPKHKFHWRKLISETQLYPWQREILSIITNPPDERSVYWHTDHTGGAGKTSFAKYLLTHYDAFYCSMRPQYHENVAQVALFVEPKAVAAGRDADSRDMSQIAIVDVKRGTVIDYEFLEALNDGLMVNTKYHPVQLRFNPGHLFVFANEDPDITRLSADRWKIKHVSHPLPPVPGEAE